MNESREVITDIFTDAMEQREDIISSEDRWDVTLNEPTGVRPRRSRGTRRFQNFILVWLDSSIDDVNDSDCRKVMTDIRQVIDVVDTFTVVDECVSFIAAIKEEKIFLILSEEYVETMIPVIHDLSQLNSIYIFPGNKTPHKERIKQWAKIKDVFADITSMSDELKKVIQEYDQNSISVSFVQSNGGSTNQNLDQHDQSFMYTQILKEILLTINFEQQHMSEFFMYCRELFVDNIPKLKDVDKLEKHYFNKTPIWWYTSECFLYSMLNRALRLMKMDIIIKLGFFVRDLHQHIAQLHSKQYFGCNLSRSFTVYRGQGLSRTDFERLCKTQDGLLSFNAFLSTTLDRHVSLAFAEASQSNPDLVGILFEITINPAIASTPFGNVRHISRYEEEEEILFSMHSVFCIEQIQQIDSNIRLWQVDLTLASDSDSQLHALTESIRKEVVPHKRGWYRLGSLLLKVAQFNEAQEVFKIMLEQTCDENEKANIYHMLGVVKYNEGAYAEAITFYETSIEIMKKNLPPTHPDLAASYRNIGTVYDKMGEYSKALSYHKKALKTYQNIVPSNHFIFPASGDNSSLTDEIINNVSRAVLSFERAFEILQQTLPGDDLSLATLYERHGSVYERMGNNVKALSFYERALKIKEKRLPSNHPSLATSYAYHGGVYKKMGDSSTAHSFHRRALNIGQRSLPADHPDLQAYRQNVENEEQEP